MKMHSTESKKSLVENETTWKSDEEKVDATLIH